MHIFFFIYISMSEEAVRLCAYIHMWACVSTKLFRWWQTTDTIKPNTETGPMTGICKFICRLLSLSCCSTDLNTSNWNCMVHKVYKIFIIWPGDSDSKECAWNVGSYQDVPGGSVVKNLPAMWETWVPSLGWENPLEKGKDTHSSILTWRIPWTV